MPPKKWDKRFCGIILDEPSGFYKMHNGKRTYTYCACDKALAKCRSEYCAYVSARCSAVSKWVETCVNTAHNVHCAAWRSAAAVARLASTGNNVIVVASRNAAVVAYIASISRVTVPGKSATSATRVLRKRTLYTYAAFDDTRRS